MLGTINMEYTGKCFEEGFIHGKMMGFCHPERWKTSEVAPPKTRVEVTQGSLRAGIVVRVCTSQFRCFSMMLWRSRMIILQNGRRLTSYDDCM
jgi:hypothetical protein